MIFTFQSMAQPVFVYAFRIIGSLSQLSNFTIKFIKTNPHMCWFFILNFFKYVFFRHLYFRK